MQTNFHWKAWYFLEEKSSKNISETFKMADLVDSILIHHTPTSFDTVSFAMTIFALRYTSLEFYYSAVSMRGVLKFAEAS